MKTYVQKYNNFLILMMIWAVNQNIIIMFSPNKLHFFKRQILTIAVLPVPSEWGS